MKKRESTVLFILILFLNGCLIYSCKKDNTPSIIQPSSLHLSESSVNLAVGGREKLFVTAEPSNADLSKSGWTSADTAIAKVDKDGIVTAISAGETTITYKTDNNLVQQCEFNVVASPVSGIVLPLANYPIGNGLKFIIQGTGFTASDKIWFRKASYSVSGIKSTLDGDDILGEIHELAGNFINVSGGAENGWYSVYLEDGGILYNLGNLEFSTYQVPAFVYDPNKIFWDDTHWRRFQLRGKVKEMKTNQIYFPYWSESSSFTFNDKGFLEASVIGSYPTSYQYDSQNRLVKKIEGTSISNFHASDIDLLTINYSYGNHSQYIPIELDWYASFPSVNYQEFYNGGLNYHDRYDLQMFQKGLEKVEMKMHYKDNTTITEFYNLMLNGDSITCSGVTEMYTGEYEMWNYKLIWKFKEGFPSEYEYNLYQKSTGLIWTKRKRNNNFSSNGMPTNFVDSTKVNCGTTVSDQSANGMFMPSCPFNIYMAFSSPNNSGGILGYDQNWDVTTYRDDYENIDFYYTSYDAQGNWTQCYVISKTISNGYTQLSILNRDFTYWQ